MSRCAVFLLLFLTGCAGARIDLGAGDPPPAGLYLSVVEVKDGTDGTNVVFDLLNESDREFVFRGYSREHPLFAYQYLTEAGWIQPARVLCGTGLGDVFLGIGERVRMTAQVFSRNRLRRVRVGIESSDGSFVVWSPVIDPALRQAGPARP